MRYEIYIFLEIKTKNTDIIELRKSKTSEIDNKFIIFFPIFRWLIVIFTDLINQLSSHQVHLSWIQILS